MFPTRNVLALLYVKKAEILFLVQALRKKRKQLWLQIVTQSVSDILLL